MTKQEITYYPDSYDIKDFTEYYGNNVVKNERYDDRGNKIYEKIDTITTTYQYNNKNQLHGIKRVEDTKISVNQVSKYYNGMLHGSYKSYLRGVVNGITFYFHGKTLGTQVIFDGHDELFKYKRYMGIKLDEVIYYNGSQIGYHEHFKPIIITNSQRYEYKVERTYLPEYFKNRTKNNFNYKDSKLLIFK